MPARPITESIFRIAVDVASSRAHQIDFLLRVVEAKSVDGAVRFLRAGADVAELVIRDAEVSTGAGERRHLEVARSGHSPVTLCPSPIPIAEPLSLRSITAALHAAVGSASAGVDLSSVPPEVVAEAAHRVLDRWLRRRSPTSDLHLVSRDGSVVLALLADGRSRLGATCGTVADALRSSWEFHDSGAPPTAPAQLADTPDRPLSQMLWDIAQLAGTERWAGDLGPEATVELRFWPFQAADGPLAASQVLRRLRKGAASVSELLALASNGREDAVRVLNACLAIEAIALIDRGPQGQPAAVEDPVPVVVLGEAPTRLRRMLASIRRVLAID